MISKKRIVTVVFLACLQYCTGQDEGSFNWCDPGLDCGPLKNSMCYLTKKENANTCFFMEDVMTADDKRLLLVLHNSARDQLAKGGIKGWPSSSDMRQMHWDDTLAAQATLWALQCNSTDSDPCPKHPYYPQVGQTSIAVGDTDDFPDVTTIFNKMIHMGKDGAKLIDKWEEMPGAKEGHRNFHQIIFARQTAVGCGLIRYLQTLTSKDGEQVAVFTLSLWCNYGIGLQAGENVYSKGDSCRKCPDYTTCRSNSTYPHLCAKADESMHGTFIDVVPRGDVHRVKPATFLVLFSLMMATYWYFE